MTPVRSGNLLFAGGSSKKNILIQLASDKPEASVLVSFLSWNFRVNELATLARDSMTKKRRRFTAIEKADAVWKHIRGKVPVSQIADEIHVQPTQIHNWVNCVLSQAERAFEPTKQGKNESGRHNAELAEKNKMIDTMNAVIAELAEKLIRTNNPNSPFDVSEKR